LQDRLDVRPGAASLHHARRLQLAGVVNDGRARREPSAGAAHEVRLSIGGLILRVASDDPRLASSVDEPLRSFSADHGIPDVDIRAAWTDAPPERPGKLLFDSGGTWQLFQSDGEFVFTVRSGADHAVLYKVARFTQDFTAGEVELDRRHFDQGSSDAVYALQYPLDELVMIHLLSQGKGVEIHGCALLDRAGRAYLFAGQSGAGKSTIGRLWADRPEVTLLSDERVVLRTDRDRVAVYGTPWHGDALLASPRSGELAAVFFLKHGPTHDVVPTRGPLAAAKLFSCAFLPFHSAEGVDRTMIAVERVTRDVPCYDLWFAPDRSVIEILTKHMA
jgi:hypothetical protein